MEHWKAGNILVLSLVLVAFGVSGLRAATIYLGVSGTLTDGAVLSGTMSIDNVAGVVTTADFATSAPYPAIFNVIAYDAKVGPAWELVTTPPGGGYPALFLFFPTPTLIGYGGGGPLCPTDGCDFGSLIVPPGPGGGGGQDINLQAASTVTG